MKMESLEDKLISDYKFKLQEDTENFEHAAREYLEKTLKEYALDNYSITHLTTTFSKSVGVMIFRVVHGNVHDQRTKQKALKLIVTSDGISNAFELAVVLYCRKCKEEDWAYFYSKNELGEVLDDFRTYHECASMGERIVKFIEHELRENAAEIESELARIECECDQCRDGHGEEDD
jgi:hypothetical protein